MNDLNDKGSEAARVAWLYYHEDLTQADIARELGISRSTVTRLLLRAKTEGLVQIKLNVSAATFKSEREIERAYGLKRLRIVPFARDERKLKHWLGLAAAEYLNEIVTEYSTIAVSWGTTLQAMADALVGRRPVTGVQIVTLVGGLHNASRGTNTFEVSERWGQYFAAPVRTLHAPVYVQNETTSLALANDPGIQQALELARKASIVVYSLGAMNEETTMFQLGYLAPEQKRFLSEKGAVADIGCRWIDRNGITIELPSSINPISISLADFKNIPTRLAVVGGEIKHEAVHAALRGGFMTDLVTDERTAEYLLSTV